ncbi:zf-HC2 domain-containing protein [bacterium]|nr:zf-HC2 domain-containing protein [bacterium]
MNCNKTIKQLPAYLDHELSRQEVAELELHLEICIFCSTELGALRATSKMLDAWQDTSPRRRYVDSVLNQIRAEERGVTGKAKIGMRLLHQRCVPTAIRAAAAIVFLIGFSVFSGHVPIKRTQDGVALSGVGDLEPAKPIPPEKYLMPSYIRPSEIGLVLRGYDNRSPIVKTSSGGLPIRNSRDGRFFFGRGGFTEVNHVYFPRDGMSVESVVPLELP